MAGPICSHVAGLLSMAQGIEKPFLYFSLGCGSKRLGLRFHCHSGAPQAAVRARSR
jgi:hypothetical protein